MSAASVSSSPLPPLVHFIDGRPSFCIGDESGGWHRCSLEQDAYLRTGVASNPRESHVGVYVRKRQNGRYLIGFDLWRLPLLLRDDVADRLRERWRAEVEALPKAIRRRIRFRGGVTALEVETMAENVEQWKGELEAVLSDPRTYEHIVRETDGF